MTRIARWADAPEEYRALIDEPRDWLQWSSDPITDRVSWVNVALAHHKDGTYVRAGDSLLAGGVTE